MSDSIPERPQSSFTSRRPAASNLPHFSLPPPPDVPSAKTSANMSGGSRQDFGGSAAASQSSTPTYPQLTGLWPTPQARINAYNTYNPPGSQELTGQTHQLPKVHPPSPFQQYLSSITTNPFPGAGQPAPSTRDGDAGAQTQQPAASRTEDDPSSSQAFSTTTAQYQLPGYSSYRQPPSPGYYYPASTNPQQPSFPPFPPPQPSPSIPSPSTSSSTYRSTPIVPSSYPSHPSPKLPGPGPSDNPRPGLSPLGGLPGMGPPPAHLNPPPPQPSPGLPPHQQPQPQQQQQQQQQPPWPGLSRPLHPHIHPHPHPHQHPPAHHGPVMSNLHQPGTPMSLVPGGGGGGGGVQHFGHGQPFPYRMTHGGGYIQAGGGGASGSGAHQDRPFKCDQCPQSFNRNHDLKRHKRIHLPVKPFPCGVCEKSFSRKDALKRHRLVKECGGRVGAKVVAAMGEGEGEEEEEGESPGEMGHPLGGGMAMKVERGEGRGGGVGDLED
ncbi:hypothetical protein B0T18DRAFT_251771 [Schizothecium vesticola]|uniref:C2H2-type domain-containing protein n=1 Tax=Schizothecium vesticola TaxID=314040 RepID=A0AA40BQT9_9PEZI|nr:hypothetical protein B0T18DRAFT_251771 [Schizothecium vesticola]